jgi:hypothetical protein
MNYQIGMVLKEADIGLLGERISFIHCGHAADAVPELMDHLKSIENNTVVVNRWTREQLRRLSFVLMNPDVQAAVSGGNGVGIVNRRRLIEALEVENAQ